MKDINWEEDWDDSEDDGEDYFQKEILRLCKHYTNSYDTTMGNIFNKKDKNDAVCNSFIDCMKYCNGEIKHGYIAHIVKRNMFYRLGIRGI